MDMGNFRSEGLPSGLKHRSRPKGSGFRLLLSIFNGNNGNKNSGSDSGSNKTDLNFGVERV